MTLVEAVLHQSSKDSLLPLGLEDGASSERIPELRRQISKDIVADRLQDEADTMAGMHLMGEEILATIDLDGPDFLSTEQMLESQEFNYSLKARTLVSMGGLLEDYIRRMFGVFLSTYDQPTATQMQDMLESLRKGSMKIIMEFLDNRLIQDRESFLTMKRALVKEVQVARDTSHLFMNTLEVSTTQKKVESVNLLQREYRVAVEKEKVGVKDEMKRLISSYDTLWNLRLTDRTEIAKLEATIVQLEKSILEMSEQHRNVIAKLIEDHQEAMDIARNDHVFLKRAQDGTLGDESSDDEKDEDSRLCASCDKLKVKVAELETQLRIADAVYAMKTAPPVKIIVESPDKSKRKKRVVPPIVVNDSNRRTSKKPMNSARQVPRKPNSRQGRQGSRRSLSNAGGRRDDAASDVSDDDSDNESVMSRVDSHLMGRGKNDRRSTRASYDSNMSDDSQDLDLASVRGTRAPPSGLMKSQLTREQEQLMESITSSLRLDTAKLAVVANALATGQIGKAPHRTVENSTQTADSIDELLRTYLEATKAASAMYVEASTGLKDSRLRVAVLETSEADLKQRLEVTTTQLRHISDLHDLQLKERNLLLVELTDQLTVVRKKLLKEQKIREHIVKNDASVVGLDRSPVYRREQYTLPVLKLDSAQSPGYGYSYSGSAGGSIGGSGSSTFLTGSGEEGRNLYAPWSAALSQVNIPSPPPAHSPTRDRSASPDDRGRRPSTSAGTSVSQAAPNIRHELRKKIRQSEPDYPLSSSPNSIDSHMFAKQHRITDEAGHKAVGIFSQVGLRDTGHIISLINSSPDGKIADDRMSELRNVRAHMVHLLAQKVVDKKKPLMLATARAAEDVRRGRVAPLRSPTSPLK